MKKSDFEFIKDSILNKMPSGNVVTKNKIEFDIGKWQHKTYDDNNNIRSCLRGKWCSATINILSIDESARSIDITKFLTENDFSVNGRHSYLVYCISFNKKILNDDLLFDFKKSEFVTSRYGNMISLDDTVIMINDFIKNILYI